MSTKNGTLDRRDGLRVVLAWVLVALAATALYMSWPALFDAAMHIGGMTPERAIAFPIVVDLVTIAAMLLALLVPNPARGARAFAWITLALFGLITVAGNASEAMLVDPDKLALGIVPATIINSIPAVALLMTTHLASINVFKHAPEVADHLVAAQAEVQKSAPTRARTTRPRSTRNAADREAVIQLRGQHTLGEIATITGVPKSTVARWVGPTVEGEHAWLG